MSSRPGSPAVTPVPSLCGPALEAVVEGVVRRVVREELASVCGRPAAELATLATFAREHAISVSTVRAMIRDGRLPAVKIGRALRVRRNAQIGEPVIGADVPAVRARRILGTVTPELAPESRVAAAVTRAPGPNRSRSRR